METLDGNRAAIDRGNDVARVAESDLHSWLRADGGYGGRVSLQLCQFDSAVESCDVSYGSVYGHGTIDRGVERLHGTRADQRRQAAIGNVCKAEPRVYRVA